MQDQNFFFKFVHYRHGKELKLKKLEHLPDLKEPLAMIKRHMYSDYFERYMRGIFKSMGFSRNEKANKRMSLAIGWIYFAKGVPSLCSHKSGKDGLFDPICQRCFKIFVQPDKEAFFHVLKRVIASLDEHLDSFIGKVSTEGYMLGEEKYKNKEKIVIYCRPSVNDDLNKLGTEHYYQKVLKELDFLEKDLAHLDEHGFGQAPFTKKHTNLLCYRQGCRDQRSSGDIRTGTRGQGTMDGGYFIDNEFAFFNMERIKKKSQPNINKT
jgi:hypothetical protein